MTFTTAITLNRAALLRLVAMLVEATGMGSERAATLSRFARASFLYYLRPMESATRRLIFVMASELTVKLRASRPMPATPIPRGSAAGRGRAFRLIDPRKSLGLSGRRARIKGPGPRISFFDGTDPPFERVAQAAKPVPDPAANSARLMDRLRALKDALEDLPKQAKRMARLQARRKLKPPGPGRVPPLRPGRPPGFRARGKWEVDALLRECHRLAMMAARPPDTS